MNKMVIIEKYKQAVVEMFRSEIEEKYKWINMFVMAIRFKEITNAVNEKYPELKLDAAYYVSKSLKHIVIVYKLSDGILREYEFKF